MSSSRPQSWMTGADVAYRTILHIDDDWVYAIIVELHPASTLIVGAARERRLESGPQVQAMTLAPVCEDVLRQAEDMTGKVIGTVVIPDEAMISIRGPHLQTITCSVRVRRTDRVHCHAGSDVLHPVYRFSFQSLENGTARHRGSG